MQAAKDAVTRLAKTFLYRTGFELRRVDRALERRNQERFYHPAGDCQIPNLDLVYDVCLGRKKDGFFVEVGAYDGLSFSNSSCLADNGWRGILVEPVPEYAERCRARYAGNERVRVVQTAVGSSEGSIEMTVATAYSTANPVVAQEYLATDWSRSSVEGSSSIQVPQTTLDKLLEREKVPARFDVLVVDVEGFETEVFRGFDLARWQPTVLIVELTDMHPDLSANRRNDAALARAIVGAGYEVVYKDFINCVFLHGERHRAIIESADARVSALTSGRDAQSPGHSSTSAGAF